VGSNFFWFLPAHGDGRQLVTGSFHSGGAVERAPDLDYLMLVARAAERAGFSGALIPTSAQCEDAWLIAAAVAQHTRRLKPLVAFRPGFSLPAVAAQTAASFQRLFGDRLLLNVVTGGSSAEQRAFGDFLDHDARYQRSAEFLSVVRRVWRGKPVQHEGSYYRLEDGGLPAPLAAEPLIYLGGASPAAEQVAADHADVYLMWGETPPMVQTRIDSVQRRARAAGRSIRFGIRLHVITRDMEQEAWSEAQRLLDGIPPGAIEDSRHKLGALESVGQARMLELSRGRDTLRDLEVYPNLWAGVGLVRGGAGTALIGNHEQVTERIREYEQLGIDTFILSGYPNLEEALRVGEHVLPRLR
jgi:alkanesulfonate monooxygenase